MRRALAVVALVSLSACSFVTVSRPEPGPPNHWVPCTDSRFWPIIDTATAIGYGGLGTAAIASLATDHSSYANLGIAFLLPLVVGTALGFGVSAYRGFDKVSACRARHDAYERLAPQ